MTDPNLSYPPKIVKLTLTSAVAGQPLKVINRTTGESLRLTVQKDGQTTVDLQNLESGYTDGDVIDFLLSGERLGGTSLTTSGTDPQSITFTSSAITSGLTRGI